MEGRVYLKKVRIYKLYRIYLIASKLHCISQICSQILINRLVMNFYLKYKIIELF